ncbi:MAG TPA: CBS domain-containing protein [Anaerolineaceae bacterium]|nr:CBS domain-containing protein [Anaerolineaceae bacterium]
MSKRSAAPQHIPKERKSIMELSVKGWMKDLVVFVEPEATVMEALSLMRHRYVNSLIAKKTAKHPEYGIITSTDICDEIVAKGANPATTKVHEIMNTPLISVKPTDTIQECAAKMMANRIHHLPVVDDKGNPTGMISATDFLVVAEAMGANFTERTLS